MAFGPVSRTVLKLSAADRARKKAAEPIPKMKLKPKLKLKPKKKRRRRHRTAYA